MTDSPKRADDAEIERAIFRLLDDAGPGKTVGPADAARALVAGPDWHLLMHPVRRAAVRLALGGKLVIYRKGKPVDPNDFKGVYRLGLPRHD
ncbi:MAG: DUF3253 domain-containing protein [Alphaproteobacteria bacterium]|nr:DUF3253 domain-containing protein [Alphaproteobacteria bacterium]